jgi:hypothetical protein
LVLQRDDGGPELTVPKAFSTVGGIVQDDAGFCNPEPLYGQTVSFDILAIGDSFTACTGVKATETWTTQLASLTGKSVYNLGRGGVGLYEYLQILKRYGIQKRPKIVIMNVYAGNNFRDALIYRLHKENQMQGKEGVTLEYTQSVFYQAYDWLRASVLGRHSYAANLLLASIAHGRRSLVQSTKPDFRFHLVFRDMPLAFNEKDLDSDEATHARIIVEQPNELQVFEDALKEFVRMSRAHKFLPVVAYSPSVYTVYARFADFTDPQWRVLLPRASDLQRRFFAAKSQQLGFEFVDLTPSLTQFAEEHQSERLLYLHSNLHYSPDGHRLVAELLNESLIEKNIVQGIPRATQASQAKFATH